MDSDDDYLYEATDSGNESPEGEDSEDQVGKTHILLFRKLKDKKYDFHCWVY